MTREQAIERLEKLREVVENFTTDECLKMAIRSLEAWEKVNEEIKGLDWNGDDAYWYGVSDVSAIIDKHLGEVTE